MHAIAIVARIRNYITPPTLPTLLDWNHTPANSLLQHRINIFFDRASRQNAEDALAKPPRLLVDLFSKQLRNSARFRDDPSHFVSFFVIVFKIGGDAIGHGEFFWEKDNDDDEDTRE